MDHLNQTENKKSKKSLQEIVRLIVQCLSFAFHNGYVNGWMKGKIYTGVNKMYCVPGLNCYSCPGAIGACPIGSLQAVLDSSGFRVSMYVIGFIGIVGVFCGRFVCGWLCPFGLIQDLCYKIPFFKKLKNLPGHKYLRYLRFGILAVFVILLPMSVKNQAGAGQPWFCEFICPSGTLLGGIPLVTANEYLREAIGVRFFFKLFLLFVILFAAVIYDRPFCKYICPLGALYGLANPVSIYRFQVDRESCIGCGVCQKACGADIRVWETPNSIDCIRCGKCIAACPTGALSTTFRPKKSTEGEAGSVLKPDESNMPKPEESNALKPEESSMPKPEECSMSKPEESRNQRVWAVIAGILCIAAAIVVFSTVLPLLVLIVTAGSIESLLQYQVYMYGLFVLMVPASMTLLLGAGLLIGTFRKPELLSRLRAWPKRIDSTLGVSVMITLLGYCIIAIMKEYTGIKILTFSCSFLANYALPYIALGAANGIAWLFYKKRKIG